MEKAMFHARSIEGGYPMGPHWTRRQFVARVGAAAAAIQTLDHFDLCCVLAADSKTAHTDLFDFKPVADGVYAAIAAPRYKVNSNAAVIVTNDGVVVVDSHSKPSAARALYKEIQGITNKPVRKLVNTHFHFDHWQRNQIYAEGNPGLELVATQRARENLTRPDAGLGGIPFVEKAGHHAAPGRDPKAEGRCHARQQSGDEGPPRVEPPAGRGVLPGAQELQADAADANGVLDDHAPGGRT